MYNAIVIPEVGKCNVMQNELSRLIRDTLNRYEEVGYTIADLKITLEGPHKFGNKSVRVQITEVAQ